MHMPGPSLPIAPSRVLVLSMVLAVTGCSPAPVPAVTAPPEPAAAPWADLIWIEPDLPTAPDLPGPVTEHLAAVAASDAGFVVVGYDEIGGRRDGVILHSIDGNTWSRVGLAEALRSVDLVDVAAGPDGFVALGSQTPEAGVGVTTVLLHSADGRTWQRVGLPGGADTYAASIGGGPGGYVVEGNASDGGPASWTSDDGLAWRAVRGDALGAGVSGLIRPVPDGDGWVALGSNVESPALLRSTDGTGWVAAAPIGAAADVRAYTVVAGRWGYLVRGGEGSCGLFSSCGESPITWWSGDGQAWTGLAPDGALASGGTVLVGAGDHGVLAIDGANAWTSTTGWAWDPQPEPGDGSAGVNDAVVRGDVIVAVGDRYLPDGRSVGWITVAQ